MELNQFFASIISFFQHDDKHVFLITGSVYPHAFFMQLFTELQARNLEIKSLDVQAGEFFYKSQLETSFLGMQCIYWLGDISALKVKQKDEFIRYIKEYTGPHKIFAFLDLKFEFEETKIMMHMKLKDKYFFEDAKTIWLTNDIMQGQKNAYFLQQLYKVKTAYTLEELYLLKNYQDLLAVDCKEFYEVWVSRLVVPDTSLFTLSQLFFEKKEAAFFKMWLTIKNLYSEMFWVTFWSDQVYRAYFFIAFTHEENFLGAKQVSFGLSFSFLKQTYKQYQIQELTQLHQALYEIDNALKNGGHVYLLDQLFMQFFSGNFK